MIIDFLTCKSFFQICIVNEVFLKYLTTLSNPTSRLWQLYADMQLCFTVK